MLGKPIWATKDAAHRLKDFAKGLAAVMPGGGLLVSADDAGLFEALFNALMDLIGLGDDYMGTMSFGMFGKLSSNDPIQNLSWFPEPGTPNCPISYAFPTDRTAELTQPFSAHGGRWELIVVATRSP